MSVSHQFGSAEKPLPVSVAERARRYVEKSDPAVSGQGGHGQALAVACALTWGFDLPEAEAWTILSDYNTRCAPPWSDRELRHKINESLKITTHQKPRGHLCGQLRDSCSSNGHPRDSRTSNQLADSAKCRKPTVDPVTAAENYLAGFRCDEAELWEASPIRPADCSEQDAALLIGALFRPGDRISITHRVEVVAYVADREEWLNRFSCRTTVGGECGAFIRMNPGGNTDAEIAAHRFMLLESDVLPIDLQLALWARLSLPIAAIVHSGGKSAHAWVKVDAIDQAEYRAVVGQLLAMLVPLGVDANTKNPSRYSRLPGASRGDHVQRLLYLNPDPEQRRIL